MSNYTFYDRASGQYVGGVTLSGMAEVKVDWVQGRANALHMDAGLASGLLLVLRANGYTQLDTDTQ